MESSLPPVDFSDLCEEDKLKFPKNNEIKQIVQRIRQQTIKGCDSEILKKEHPDFARLLPHLFNAATNVNFSLDLLDYFLEKSASLKSDGAGIVDADTLVYGKLRQVYGPDSRKRQKT